MIFRIARCHGESMFITLGKVRASERNARGVERIETLRNAFVGTDRKGEFTQQQIAAIAIDFLETPAECKAVKHVGTNTRTQEQIEGLVSKKLWGQ